jgi:hypothetical protein
MQGQVKLKSWFDNVCILKSGNPGLFASVTVSGERGKLDDVVRGRVVPTARAIIQIDSLRVRSIVKLTKINYLI